MERTRRAGTRSEERTRTHRGSQLDRIAFPLGGIGTGTVSLGGRGRLQDWEIFNRPSKGLTLENTFFAVWARAEGRPALCRVAEARSRGERTKWSMPAFRDAAFTARYPFACIAFSDQDFPLRLRLEAFSPFIPFKDIDSGLPAAVFLWTVSNPGRRRVEASLAASLLNPIGLDGTEREAGRRNPAFGGNVNELVHENHIWAMKMSSNRYTEGDVRYGTMALAFMWPKVSVVTRWPSHGGWEWTDARALWDDIADDGALRGPSDAVPTPDGRTEGATMCAMMDLAPGESLTVPVILTWHFPNRVNDWNSESEAAGKVIRNYYASWFKDAWAVTGYTVREFERLRRESREFEGALHSSTLPAEVVESVANQLSTMRSPVCFRDEEGRFYGFEGAGDRQGCCPMNCTHVWNYAQAVAFMFPELERSMRETDFLVNTRPGGDMAFRTIVPLSSGVIWSHIPAADGQMGTLMRLYRDWQISGDEAFLRRIWPKAREALEFAWKGWDADRDGLMEGEQHNTFDVELYGPNPLCSVLYLGALRAGEEMARAVGEGDLAREYRRLFEMGSQRIQDRLWEGEYFIQSPDAQAGKPNQLGPACLSDQLLGQWLAHVAGIGYLLPRERVRKALASVFKYNYRSSMAEHPNAARVFAEGDEAGLLVCSWPKGGRPAAAMPYADEVWSGTEYQAAAHMIYEGLVQEGLTVVRGVRERYDGERRNPFSEVECGEHYVRAMSSWSLLLACTGFRWSAVSGILRFVPAIPARRFQSFFSTGTAWGVAEEGNVGRRGLVAIRVYDGLLRLSRLRISPGFRGLTRCWTEPSSTFLRGRFERLKEECQVEFDAAVVLSRGQALILELRR